MSDNKKINWTPELLAECRNEKGVVLGMMSAEARDALYCTRKEQGYATADNCRVEVMSQFAGWVCIWGPFVSLSDNRAYRLSPSYTPPELAPKPYVDCPVELTNRREYVFNRHDGWRLELSYAVDLADFAGYVFANGTVCINCRLPYGKDGPFEAPVAVRFWTGTGGAK